jgi:pyrimidine oxygenase
MIKMRGYGGVTEHWDYNLESFTLMAGLAAVTNKIMLFASVPVLVLPPAVVARMGSTIDSIAPGRFGINIVTGWQTAEYDQMRLWPGPDYFGCVMIFLPLIGQALTETDTDMSTQQNMCR